MRVRVRERLRGATAGRAPASASSTLRVGVEHALAAEQLDRVEEVPARADRRVDLEPVLHAGVEVVGAVAGRGVHGARARSSVT